MAAKNGRIDHEAEKKRKENREKAEKGIYNILEWFEFEWLFKNKIKKINEKLQNEKEFLYQNIENCIDLYNAYLKEKSDFNWKAKEKVEKDWFKLNLELSYGDLVKRCTGIVFKREIFDVIGKPKMLKKASRFINTLKKYDITEGSSEGDFDGKIDVVYNVKIINELESMLKNMRDRYINQNAGNSITETPEYKKIRNQYDEIDNLHLYQKLRDSGYHNWIKKNKSKDNVQ